MHDPRFKRLLKEFFAEFFWLFFPSWAERFDFDDVDWLDKEIISDALQGESRFVDVVRFNYPYVGLPALDAEQYVRQDNWLGVALAALMRVSQERRIALAGEALQRLVHCPENGYRKTLLCECLSAYLPLDDDQRQQFEDMVRNHPDSEVSAMEMGLLDHIEQRGLERGKLEGKLECFGSA